MDWQDVRVQLIDLPPVTVEFLEPFVTSMTRSADAALYSSTWVMTMVRSERKVSSSAWPSTRRFGGTPPLEPPRLASRTIRTMIVATKCDDAGAIDRLQFTAELFGDGFPIHRVDADPGMVSKNARSHLSVFECHSCLFQGTGKAVDKSHHLLARFKVPSPSLQVAFIATLREMQIGTGVGFRCIRRTDRGRDHVLTMAMLSSCMCSSPICGLSLRQLSVTMR